MLAYGKFNRYSHKHTSLFCNIDFLRSAVWKLRLGELECGFPFPRSKPGWGRKAKQIDGDLIRWTESFLSDRTVEMVIEGNVLQSHPVEAGVPQGSPVSPILFAIHTAWLIKWVEERVQGVEGLFFVDDLG